MLRFVIAVYSLAAVVAGESLASLGEALLGRVKRQAAMDDMDSCSKNCVMSLGLSMMTRMKEKGMDLSAAMGPGGLGGPGFLSAGLNETFIRTLCAAYKENAGCFDKCPAGSAQSPGQGAFAMMDFACVKHYDTFLSLVSCAKDGLATIAKSCGDKCQASGPSKGIVASQDDKMAQMAQACDMIHCLGDCMETGAKEKCEAQPGAGQFVRDMVRLGGGQMGAMIKGAGKDAELPESCKKAFSGIKSGDKPQADQPPRKIRVKMQMPDPSESGVAAARSMTALAVASLLLLVL